jgi:CubicO group peptidase (beta-lactamase class C family)
MFTGRKQPIFRSFADEIVRVAAGSTAPLAAGFWSGDIGKKGAVPASACDLRFEIGSVTKAITGTLFGIMVETGEVDPNAPVDEVMGQKLPWADRPPTLVELASHRAGLPNTPGRLWWREAVAAFGWSAKDPWHSVDEAAYRAMLGQAARKAGVGRRVSYSSMGVGLLGDALACAGGKPFDRLVAERVFAPLGMSRTDFSRPESGAEVVTVGVSRSGRQMPYLRDHMPAAGMLASTVDDLLCLCRASCGEGPSAVVAGIRRAQTPVVAGIRRAQTPVAAFSGIQIGYCWLIADSDRGRVAFHNGGTWGSQAHISVAPERHRAVVMLSGTHRDMDGACGRIGLMGLALPRMATRW